MILTSRLQEALNHAARLHRNEIRRDEEQTPYFSHLISVAIIISNYTEDEDILIAALMHDAVEDVPGITIEYIKSIYGERVATLVQAVTEPKPDILGKSVEEYWYEKKHAYLHSLQSGPVEALYIAAGDKIHNMRSMREGIEKHGRDHLRKFVSGAIEKQLWFYHEVEHILTSKLKSPLVDMFKEELRKFELLK